MEVGRREEGGTTTEHSLRERSFIRKAADNSVKTVFREFMSENASQESKCQVSCKGRGKKRDALLKTGGCEGEPAATQRMNLLI